MKTITRLVAFSAFACAASQAVALIPINEDAEVFVTASVGLKADDNIFMSPTEVSDTIFDFSPGLQLVFGGSSAVKGSLYLAESFTRYSDRSELDDELGTVGLNTSYDDGKSKLSFNLSYTELNQNTVDTLPAFPVNVLIRRNVFGTGGNGEISVTEKSSVSAGVQYQKTDYKRRGFSDTQTVTIPVNYYYEITPKVDLSFGYRFRESWLQFGQDSKDHFFNVGARGEFTAKLSGQIAVGVTQRNFETQNDTSLLGIDSSLNYAVSPKTSVQFGVTNDFDTNSQGQQQKNFTVRGSVSSRILEAWTVSAGASYRAIDYYTRKDDYVEGNLSATYSVSERFSVTGAVIFRSNDSDLPTSDFDNRVVSLSASVRF